MLSLFPEILFLSPFAATLIRVALAVLLAYEGWLHISDRDMRIRGSSICEILVAVALFAGAWTQLAALGASIGFTVSLLIPQYRTYAKSTYILALVMALSLVVTGAGPFAFDLPL